MFAQKFKRYAAIAATRSVPSAMFVPIEPRVARMVDSMHREKYRRDPTMSWRRVLAGADSGGNWSSGVVSCGWLESYWGAVQTFWGNVRSVKTRPHFVYVTGHGFFHPSLGVIPFESHSEVSYTSE